MLAQETAMLMAFANNGQDYDTTALDRLQAHYEFDAPGADGAPVPHTAEDLAAMMAQAAQNQPPNASKPSE